MPASVRENTRVTTVDEGFDVYTKKVTTIKRNKNKNNNKNQQRQGVSERLEERNEDLEIDDSKSLSEMK